ncbi:MAG: hypothetical protein KF799_00105 [Bdellovibrionales bacterium]|nr:hypothetical protein [Bdellovibrionales bacterium]
MTRWILAALLAHSVNVLAGPKLGDLVQPSVRPEVPVVILGATRDHNGNGVLGPWFGARIVVENQSSQTLTIVSVIYDIFDPADKSKPLKTIVFAPADYNRTTICNSVVTEIRYVSFGTYLPGDRGVLRLGVDPAMASCDEIEPAFFLAGEVGPPLPGFRYEVVVRLQGWFGNAGNRTESLAKTFVFYTK